MVFPDAMMERVTDARSCRELLRGGSRSFFAASHLLPAGVRESATALYAFCRLADDAVDLADRSPGHPAADPAGGRGPAARNLERLRRRLDRVYAGASLPLAADRAFAATVRVAGSVGVMMALVMGVRDPAALSAASALGAAMQLTNICRDVGEDAAAGRLYLPLLQLRGAAIDPERFLAAPRFTPALGAIVAALLDEAERLYVIGFAGVAALPPACRPGIRAAALLYRAIGREVGRRGFDSVGGRARVAAPAKAALLLAALLPRPATAPRPAVELPAAAFLLAGIAPIAPSRRGIGETAGWVLDLFGRVEERRRLLDRSEEPEPA